MSGFLELFVELTEIWRQTMAFNQMFVAFQNAFPDWGLALIGYFSLIQYTGGFDNRVALGEGLQVVGTRLGGEYVRKDVEIDMTLQGEQQNTKLISVTCKEAMYVKEKRGLLKRINIFSAYVSLA